MKVWLKSLAIAKIRKLPVNDQRRGWEITKIKQENFLYEWEQFKKREQS
jgi:hypothetical protein